jgi:hypothetical protein
MTPNIQIDESTMRRLSMIKEKLEQQQDRVMGYGEVIDFLVDNLATDLFHTEDLDTFRALGRDSEGALDELRRERKKELLREEKKAPLPKSEYSDELRKNLFEEKTNT